MAIVIEDGTGKPDAQSYASAGDADSYLAARGYTIWAPLQSTEKDQALVRATDYLMSYFWKGERVGATQALDWPRKGITAFGFDIGENVIPPAVRYGTIELAFRAAAGALFPDIPYDETGRLATKLVERVGPIDEETTYAARGQLAIPVITRRFPAVDYILAQFIQTTSNTVYR